MIEIYTDGSCYPNPGGDGGWAFVVTQSGRTIHSESGADVHTTNNRMELTALLRAIEWWLDNGHDNKVKIYSDSNYVVKGFNEWMHKWFKKKKPKAKNLDLWRDVYNANKSFKGQVLWCRGHVGTRGNEEADLLANNARLG